MWARITPPLPVFIRQRTIQQPKRRFTMSILNKRERELVAIGAAMGSNCVPCIEYHIQQSRKCGLSDAEITEAIEFADKIKRIPADKVLEAASNRLSAQYDEQMSAPASCCQAASTASSCC
jgi:4-carboxymuconolactone decarboxylase